MSYLNVTVFGELETTTEPIKTFPTTTSDRAPDPYIPDVNLEYCYFAIHLLIFIPSFLGNSLSFLALLASRSNLYPWFLNLVIADLVKTVVCMPYSMYILLNHEDFRRGGKLQPPLCVPEGYLFLVCLLVSLVSNAGISIDRVIAIISPFYYAKKLIRTHPLFIILPTWIIVMCICIVPMVDTRGYVYATFIPMCYMELHNMLTGWKVDSTETRWIVPIVHFVIIGIPMIIVCVSCLIVTAKLCKVTRIKSIFSYKKTMSKLTLTEKGDSLESNKSVRSNNLSTMSARISLDESTQVSNLSRNGSRHKLEIEDNRGVNSSWTEEKDRMVMLHSKASPSKNKYHDKLKRRKQIQKRAVITMILVAVTFVSCHIMMLVFWVFWDVIGDKYNSCAVPRNKQPHEEFSYGVCVSYHTLQITMVYLNSPLNVLIYYLRCTYLKERMWEFLTSFLTSLKLLICNTFRRRRVND